MKSLWNDDLPDLMTVDALTGFVFAKRKAEHSVYFAHHTDSGRQVTMKVLTVDEEAARERFIQEAALFKLLDHKAIPKFVGVLTLPPHFGEVKESKEKPLPAFVTSQNKWTPLSSFLHTAQLKKKNRRQRALYYAQLVDVLLDASDALCHLHAQRPAVLYRSPSMGNIAVTQTDSGDVYGSLNDMNNALICAEETRHVERLGMDSLKEGEFSHTGLLSMEFFKVPSQCSVASPPSPRRAPRSPLKDLPILDKTRKAPVRVEVAQPLKSVSKAKKAKKSDIPEGSSAVSKSKKKLETVKKAPVKLQSGGVFKAEADRKKCVSSHPIGRGPAAHSAVPSFGSAHEGPRAPPSLSIGSSMRSSFSSERASRKIRGYDSASSPKWVDSLPRNKKVDSKVGLSSHSLSSDAISAKKRHVSWCPTEGGDGVGSNSSVTIDEEDCFTRVDSLAHLKQSTGEANLAPEVLRGEPYGTASDVYSFGLVIYSAIARMAPVLLSTKPGHLQFTFSKTFPAEIQSLILDCCQGKAQSRPTMTAVRERLQSIKESGCLRSLTEKKRRSFSCFGYFG